MKYNHITYTFSFSKIPHEHSYYHTHFIIEDTKIQIS